MNINDLTIGQAKELAKLFGQQPEKSGGLDYFVGKKVIVRTYSAGCWFGTIDEKSGSEVILKDARRMYYWKTKKGISLSSCALYGVSDESKIVEPVSKMWLEAIEIISCTDEAIESLEGASYVEAR